MFIALLLALATSTAVARLFSITIAGIMILIMPNATATYCRMCAIFAKCFVAWFVCVIKRGFEPRVGFRDSGLAVERNDENGGFGCA